MAFPALVNFLRIILFVISVFVPFIHGVRIEEKGKIMSSNNSVKLSF